MTEHIENIPPLFESLIEPRWFDADVLGHINHALYFRYLEEARVRWMADAGLYGRGSDSDFGMVMVNAGLDFKRQHHHPEALRARAFVVRIGNSSFTLRQQLLAADSGLLVAEGEATLVWVRLADSRPTPIGEALRGLLEAHLLVP